MIVLIFAAFIAGTNAAVTKCQVSSPQWNPVYTVKGSLIIPYAELVEPFVAWYDKPNGRSRIDYYGGMVQTFQLTNDQNGVSRKVTPITTEDKLNARTCLEVNGTQDNPITAQAILPDLTGFECLGQEVINGFGTEKWRLVSHDLDRVSKYTIWMRYKQPADSPQMLAIPIRYEMKGYNTLLGSHYDHYYLDYEYFDVESIPDDVFQLKQDMECESFPGPGERHLVTFNPMQEFVHPVKDAHVEEEFKLFKQRHNVSYANHKEHHTRKEHFRQNLRFIQSKNRANLSYRLAINHLADRSELEMKALRGKIFTGHKYNGGKPFPYKETELKRLVSALPNQFDWRLYGAVTPVKDQSVCGSCWAFGTIGAIEGAYFLKNGGHLMRLSQQALIDCSWGFGNNGCDGGEDFRVYQWMLKHGGVPTEDDYGAYLGQDGYCHLENITLAAKITGFVNVTVNNEDALRIALLKNGPVSVSIDASQRTLSFYSRGVYYEPKCKNNVEGLDHAVLAVGYGEINGNRYWLVKNSWSTYWGNDGYILMSSKDNNCGVMTAPTYPTM